MGVPMNKKNKETMYELLRDLSDVQGIARMTILSLNAFIESLKQLKCTRARFDPLYTELSETVKRAQPNLIPLNHLLEFFEDEMARTLKPGMDIDTVKRLTISSLEQKILQFKRNTTRVTENGLSYIRNRDVIIVHSASTVVTNILIDAKRELNRQFKVIILDHNAERTRQTVQALRDAGIEYIVTPANNLAHHIEAATKMFVGAMTITADRKIVGAIGTAGVVGLCRLHKVKVHLFANTLNYSHRTSVEQEIFQRDRATQIGGTDFSMKTHSHDLVRLDFIDHIITEIGEVNADGRLIVPPVSLSKLKGKAVDMIGIKGGILPGPEVSLA